MAFGTQVIIVESGTVVGRVAAGEGPAEQILISSLGGGSKVTFGAEPVSPSVGDYWIPPRGNAFIRVTPPTAAKFNITEAGADIVVANTVVTGGNFFSIASALANAGLSSGKAVFQVTADVITTPGENTGIGFATSAFPLSGGYLGSDTNSVGLFEDGKIFLNAVNVITMDTFIAGDVITIAVDRTASLAWWRVNAGNWNGSPTADPVSGVEGLDISIIVGDLLPGVSFNAVLGSQFTFNFLPGLGLTGFSNWPQSLDPWQGVSQF
jgi:hypothetical protein